MKVYLTLNTYLYFSFHFSSKVFVLIEPNIYGLSILVNQILFMGSVGFMTIDSQQTQFKWPNYKKISALIDFPLYIIAKE